MIAMSHDFIEQPIFNVTQAAKALGCTNGWVRLLLRTKKITGRKMSPRCWVLTAAELEKARALMGPGIRANRIAKKAARSAKPLPDKRPAKRGSGSPGRNA
jgi:hypothetical protein